MVQEKYRKCFQLQQSWESDAICLSVQWLSFAIWWSFFPYGAKTITRKENSMLFKLSSWNITGNLYHYLPWYWSARTSFAQHSQCFHISAYFRTVFKEFLKQLITFLLLQIRKKITTTIFLTWLMFEDKQKQFPKL